MYYRVYLTTKIKAKNLEKGTGIIVIEPDDYTSTEIKAIKSKGYKVLGYLSVGTIEKERTWYKTYKNCGLKKLEDWPNERYADLTKKKWQEFVVSRAKNLKKRGFDGYWCDNIDVVEYYPSDEMLQSCIDILTTIKEIGGYVMINGGSKFLEECIKTGVDPKGFINGYTQEEVFSRITSYSGKGKFGVQHKKETTYYKKIIDICNTRKMETYLLEYSKDDSVKEKIRQFYKLGGCTGYYIAKDVNL